MTTIYEHKAGLIIGHDTENDYVGVYNTLLTKVNGQVGDIHQICQLMSLEALEKLGQHVNDQWVFETGTENDRKVLEIIELWLKIKRD